MKIVASLSYRGTLWCLQWCTSLQATSPFRIRTSACIHSVYDTYVLVSPTVWCIAQERVSITVKNYR